MTSRTACLLIACACAVGRRGAPASADLLVVRLGAGAGPVTAETPRREVRCVILDESDTQYRVRTEHGSATYPKARILSVEWHDADTNAALRAEFDAETADRKEGKQRARAHRQAELERAARENILEDKPSSIRRCPLGICLQVEEADGIARFDVENCYRAPITVGISLTESRNTTATEEFPFMSVVPPQTRRQLLFLQRKNPEHSWRYTHRMWATFGDPAVEHDDTVRYRLPWRTGEAHHVSQGVNGTFTHHGRAAYSFDFPMPIGTPIAAARDGTVVQVIDGYSEADAGRILFGPPANQLIVMHADGTFAVYAHLNNGGTRVYESQRVQAGQIIAESGHTGYSTGPHLHFAVGKARPDGRSETVDIRFGNRSPTGYVPQAGRAYTAF